MFWNLWLISRIMCWFHGIVYLHNSAFMSKVNTMISYCSAFCILLHALLGQTLLLILVQHIQWWNGFNILTLIRRMILTIWQVLCGSFCYNWLIYNVIVTLTLVESWRDGDVSNTLSWEWYSFLPHQTDAEEAVLNKKRSKKTEKKYKERQRTAKVESTLEDQFMTGRVLGKVYKPCEFWNQGMFVKFSNRIYLYLNYIPIKRHKHTWYRCKSY